MSLTFWVVLRRFKQSRKQERTAHALQKVSSDDREAVECGFEHERGGGWDLHNSHSSQYSPYQYQQASSMHRLEGSMATPGVRGHTERLLLSANEVGTWGSTSPRFCLSASPLCSGRRGVRQLWMPTKWHQCHLHSSSSWPQRRALWAWYGAGGATCIRYCPIGKITNGSKIAVPQSGSSLWNKCSHANWQSPHKPCGRSCPVPSL